MTANIYVVTDNHKGIVGGYETEEQALNAIEKYEEENWADADTRGEYEEDYPNEDITFGEYLVKIGDYAIKEIPMYWGE